MLFIPRGIGGARAPADPPLAGPAASGPGVAGRGFISRLWGFEMTTPRPHVFMRKHCHNALPRVQYDVPQGGPAVIQRPTLCFGRVLRFIRAKPVEAWCCQ